ncbi:MAG: pyrimidine-nucleoside phosphorylase [Oscillospiraceae bacterium]
MRMYDVIHKKREGGELSPEELQFFVAGVTDGSIPDYQTAALLMAIYFRGMTAAETAELTLRMAASGDQVDLSAIEGFKVDKHSTGGVGDKTTLIVAPIVAACGVRVAKMSGRGLGHTGGTVDKLESIPGFDTALSIERFFEVVQEVGVAVVGQTGNLAPADKKLYALRDVTATVESIPLIAASIMSKKLAAGADGIVLDVKTGSGAFMKTVDDSIRLAETMVAIGERLGRRTVALITDMDRPLGAAIGNSLEVIEAAETLRGNGPDDLTELCLELAANMLELSEHRDIAACRAQAKEALASGRGYARLKRMVAAQGGDPSVLDHPEKFPKAEFSRTVCAPRGGYLTAMDTERIGMASAVLGAGRETKEAPIDHAAGILLPVKPGQRVECGETLATLRTNQPDRLASAAEMLLDALVIGDKKPPEVPLIYARVSRDGVQRR